MRILKGRLLRRGARAGISLVEVLVSATVLSVGLGGIVVASVAAHNLTRTSQETRLATLALQQTIEPMLWFEPADLVANNPAGTAIALQDFGLEGLTIMPDYPGYAAGDSAVEITLTATWTTFDRRVRTLSIASGDS